MALVVCMGGGFAARSGGARLNGTKFECKCNGPELVMCQIDEIGEGLRQLASSRANVQDQVERLTIRLQFISNGVESAALAGASVPAQLLASLNALQREQASLSKIVELAGPTRLDGSDHDSLRFATEKSDINSLVWESSMVDKEDAIQDHVPGYTMTAEVPLAASSSIRDEIQRRVSQHLVAKGKGPQHPIPKPTSEKAQVEESVAVESRDSLLLDSRLTALEMRRTFEEKEAALNSALRVEQAKLVKLEAETSSKVSVEEMESAINTLVLNHSEVLRKCKEASKMVSAELEAIIVQLKQRLCCKDEAIMKLQEELSEAENVIFQLKEELAAAEIKRKQQQGDALSKMRILVTEMVKASKSRSENEAQVVKLMAKLAKLREEKTSDNNSELGSGVPVPTPNVISAEKMKALEKFFSVTKELLDKQKELLDNNGERMGED